LILLCAKGSAFSGISLCGGGGAEKVNIPSEVSGFVVDIVLSFVVAIAPTL
jgi:hypothetical protein